MNRLSAFWSAGVAPVVTVAPLVGPSIAANTSEKSLTGGFDAFRPIGRVGRPRDVANHIVFLLSDQASGTTGAVHDVGGVASRV